MKREKLNIMDEDKLDSTSFFNEYLIGIPVSFKVLEKYFNVGFYSTDYEKMSKIIKKESEEHYKEIKKIAGVISYFEDELHVFYNKKYDSDEQRFIIANLLAEFERRKDTFKDNNIEILKLYDDIRKSENKENIKTEDDFHYYADSSFARDILMPEEAFRVSYNLWSHIFHDNQTLVEALASKYSVPEREVKIRSHELGLVPRYVDNDIRSRVRIFK